MAPKRKQSAVAPTGAAPTTAPAKSARREPPAPSNEQADASTSKMPSLDAFKAQLRADLLRDIRNRKAGARGRALIRQTALKQRIANEQSTAGVRSAAQIQADLWKEDDSRLEGTRVLAMMKETTFEHMVECDYECDLSLAGDERGTPQMVKHRYKLLSIWRYFMTNLIKLPLDKPSMDAFHVFVEYAVLPAPDGGPSLFTKKVPDAYSVMADVPIVPDFHSVRCNLVVLYNTICSYWQAFNSSGNDLRAVDSQLANLLKHGKLDNRNHRESCDIDLHHSAHLLGVVLTKCMSEGVRSWDVLCVKLGLFSLLVNTGLRMGDINVSLQAWDSKEFGTTCGDVTIAWSAQDEIFVMELALPHTKGRHEDDDGVKVVTFNSHAPGGILCPIRWVMIVALRAGNVPYKSWDEMVLSMKGDDAGVMQWVDVTRPLFPSLDRDKVDPLRHTSHNVLQDVVNWMAAKSGLIYQGSGWLRAHDFCRDDPNQASDTPLGVGRPNQSVEATTARRAYSADRGFLSGGARHKRVAQTARQVSFAEAIVHGQGYIGAAEAEEAEAMDVQQAMMGATSGCEAEEAFLQQLDFNGFVRHCSTRNDCLLQASERADAEHLIAETPLGSQDAPTLRMFQCTGCAYESHVKRDVEIHRTRCKGKGTATAAVADDITGSATHKE